MALDIVAVSAFGTLLSGFGSLIGKVNDQSLKSEFMEKQIALLSKFQELQLAYAELAEENRRLKNELAETTRMADFGKDFTSEAGVYWKDDSPYCPNCWDVDRKPVRLASATRGMYICPIHKSPFTIHRRPSGRPVT